MEIPGAARSRVVTVHHPDPSLKWQRRPSRFSRRCVSARGQRAGVGIAPVSEYYTGDPLFRPLRIHTIDPGELTTEAATAVVSVPYARPENLDRAKVGHRRRLAPLLAAWQKDVDGESRRATPRQPGFAGRTSAGWSARTPARRGPR